jgi:HEAT repeat protein
MQALRVALGWKDDNTRRVLAPILQHPEVIVRERAVIELGRLGMHEAIVVVLPSLCDMAVPVRTAAVQALSALGWRPENPGERALEFIGRSQFGKAATQGRVALELLLPFASHPIVSIRLDVAEALGGIHDPQSMAALEKLMGDVDPGVRIAAIQSVKRMQAPVNALAKAVADVDKNVRVAAVEALGQLRDSEAVPTLMACLRDENWNVRSATATALGLIGERSTLGFLIPCLKDPDADVRVAVADALGMIGDMEAIEALVLAQLDGETSVRQAALKAVVRVDFRWFRNTRAYKTLPALKRAVRSDIYATRGAATELLERIFSIRRPQFRNASTSSPDAGMQATEILIACLWDEQPLLAGAAAETLGKLRCQEALEVLKAKAEDGHAWVRKLSAAAASLIEGHDTSGRGWHPAPNG